MRLNARKFDLLEVVLLSLLIAVGAWVVGRGDGAHSGEPPLEDEAKPLQERYGAQKNTEHEEEWIIRDYFQDRKSGFFLDVGANHYKRFSNTYYLEVNLGWSGIAIEPLRQFEADYTTHRPRTRFLPFFVSDVSNEAAKLYVLKSNPLVTSSDKEFTKRYGENPTEVTAPTITLDDLLQAQKVSTIDFMSMDIELHEPQALAGFDIKRFRPALVCIEAHPEVRQQILDYFARNDYVVAGKYLRVDRHNLYFTPLTTPQQ